MARVHVYQTPDELEGEARRIAEKIVDTRKALDGPFSVWMHAPEWAERVAHLGTMIRWEGTLELRTRTLAALVVGRHFQAQYVWGIQGVIAEERGVPRATVDAIRDGKCSAALVGGGFQRFLAGRRLLLLAPMRVALRQGAFHAGGAGVIGVFGQCPPALFQLLQAAFEQRVGAVLGKLFQGVDQGVELFLVAARLGVPGLQGLDAVAGDAHHLFVAAFAAQLTQQGGVLQTFGGGQTQRGVGAFQGQPVERFRFLDGGEGGVPARRVGAVAGHMQQHPGIAGVLDQPQPGVHRRGAVHGAGQQRHEALRGGVTHAGVAVRFDQPVQQVQVQQGRHGGGAHPGAVVVAGEFRQSFLILARIQGRDRLGANLGVAVLPRWKLSANGSRRLV